MFSSYVRTFIFLAAIATSATFAADKDPPVPPGRDPGGVAIAIIGPGLDYMLPQISEHLARDGEGEIIGWDFADNDRRPFEQDVYTGGTKCPTNATLAEELILEDAKTSRVVPVRVASTDSLQLGHAAAYVGQSPAKIALVLSASTKAEDWQFFRKAAEHFSDVLFIAEPAKVQSEDGNRIRNVDTDPIYPVSLGLENVLSVTDMPPSQMAAVGPASIDVASSGHIIWNVEDSSCYSPTALASTSIAALAARILAEEPELKGKALKARILSLATPLPAGTDPISKSGGIAEPWKLYPAR